MKTPPILKPIAAASGIAGALLIAAGHPGLMLPALSLWIMSSLLWVYVGVRQREWSLAILSLVYITIDLVGMWRWSAARG